MTKACKKGNYPCGNEEEFPCETTANPLVGFMKIPFWRTVESPLYELLSK